MFHPDAVCIYSASGALLNTYHWEPVKLYQSLDLSNLFQSSEILISDLATSHKQLVGLLIRYAHQYSSIVCRDVKCP